MNEDESLESAAVASISDYGFTVEQWQRRVPFAHRTTPPPAWPW